MTNMKLRQNILHKMKYEKEGNYCFIQLKVEGMTFANEMSLLFRSFYFTKIFCGQFYFSLSLEHFLMSLDDVCEIECYVLV